MLRIDFESTIHVTYYEPVPLASSEEPHEVMREETLDFVAFGDRFRQDLHRVMDDGARSFTSTLIWDGQRSFARQGDQPGVVLLGSSIRPLDSSSHALHFNLLEDRFPTDRPRSLHDQILTTSTRIESTDDGFDVHYRTTDPKDPWRHRLRLARHGETFLPSEWEMFLFDAERLATGEEYVVTRKVFIITEWGDISGRPIPVRAVESGMDRDRYGEPYKTLHVWERRHLAVVQSAPDSLTMALQPGMEVLDTDLNLAFVVSGRELRVDDVFYELAEPINEPPGVNLPALLAKATRVSVPFPGGQADDRSRNWVWIVTLGILGATVITVIVLRRRVAREKA